MFGCSHSTPSLFKWHTNCVCRALLFLAFGDWRDSFVCALWIQHSEIYLCCNFKYNIETNCSRVNPTFCVDLLCYFSYLEHPYSKHNGYNIITKPLTLDMFNCHTIILFLWLLMTPSDCTVRQWWGVSMVKWCLTFDSFQRQWILAIISRSCLRVAKKFPAHVGAEMKQKKHYANI